LRHISPLGSFENWKTGGKQGDRSSVSKHHTCPSVFPLRGAIHGK